MKGLKVLSSYWVCLAVILVALGCDDDFTPRPAGFFRIDLPEKTYRTFESDCPFIFEYPEYAVVVEHRSASSMPCWLNLEFPMFQGTLHLSYFEVNSEDYGDQTFATQKYVEDTRNLAMKHTVKAHAIFEEMIANEEANVYGVLYNIEGLNTASSLQFYLTDSTDHFLRGALYFNVAPRNDSLAPVINFIQEDVFKFIESFRWKSESTIRE